MISQFSERPVLLDFSEFDEESVFAFLEYIYTGSIPLLKEDSVRQQLASIAQRYTMIYDRSMLLQYVKHIHVYLLLTVYSLIVPLTKYVVQ